jgi:tellurite resistance protein TehA-like permease
MNPQWFLIAIPVALIILLAVRATVLSHTHPDSKPSPVWQQRLLLTVSVVGIGIISIPLLSMPWYIPAGVAIWLGVSVATVPQEVSWLRTIGYALQLVVTAVLMIAALVWINSHM